VLVQTRRNRLGADPVDDPTAVPAPDPAAIADPAATIATSITTSAGLMQPMTFWQLVRFHVLVAVTAQVVLMAVSGFFKRRIRGTRS
jgi:hypothetical protein